jgi:hypothetical protein
MKTEIMTLAELRQASPRPPFGEFLVEQHVLDRFQLFCALQMQDRIPGVRLGACAVALGYVRHSAIEQLHERFAESELEAMKTEAFWREPDIEIVY